MNTSLDKISILGAGWLGWPLAKKLVKQGYYVNGATTREAKLDELAQDGIHPFLIRLTPDGPEAPQLTRFLDTDLLMINIPPGRRDPDVETNFPKKIKSLIEPTIAAGVTRLLFVSSTGVFSDAQGAVGEDTPPKPATASGKALLEVENYLMEQKTFKTTILRPGGLFGGERKAGRFLAGKKDIPNGNAPVNMIHQKDIIGIIMKIIEQDQFGKIFHAVAPKHPTREAFYTREAEKQGFDRPAFLENGGDGPFKIVSSIHLQNTLNYHFKINLR